MIGLRYKDSNGVVTDRTVEPYKIDGNDFWGYDPEKGSIRRFKVKNIRKVSKTDVPFTPRWGVETDYSKPKNEVESSTDTTKQVKAQQAEVQKTAEGVRGNLEKVADKEDLRDAGLIGAGLTAPAAGQLGAASLIEDLKRLPNDPKNIEYIKNQAKALGIGDTVVRQGENDLASAAIPKDTIGKNILKFQRNEAMMNVLNDQIAAGMKEGMTNR